MAAQPDPTPMGPDDLASVEEWGPVGYDLALGGTHPFHRTTSSSVFPDVRYERILDRLAWLTYQRVVFGLHVHVGVPSGDMAIAAINHLVRYLPHLVALSASSPFWQGVDTGLSSARTALYRMLPHAGPAAYGYLGPCRIRRRTGPG